MIRIVTATLLGVAACCAPVFARQTQPTYHDLTVAVMGVKPLTLDLYIPQGVPGPLPLVIWIHGGGWSGGENYPVEFAPDLLARGYAVASLNYRLTSEPGSWGGASVVFPAQIQDVKGAVRWLRAHATQYNLDPARFGAWGSSAGGHLAALLGSSGGVTSLEGTVGGNAQFSSAVQAVADYYGPTDLMNMQPDITTPPGSIFNHDLPSSPGSKLIGFDDPGQGLGVLRANRTNPNPPYPSLVQLANAANPITWLNATDPPFFVAHGTNDMQVALKQSQRLATALDAAHVPNTFLTVQGAGHGGLGEATLTATLDFFDQHLGGGVVTPCVGDANGDHVVNFADLNAVLGGFGTPGPGGDVNADGAVNFADLNVVLAAFGHAC